MGSEEATKKVGDYDLKQVKEMSDSRKEVVNNSWVVMESCGDISVNEQSRSTAPSIENSSVNSTTSSSSSDLIEDASSSTLSSSSSSSSADDVPNGPSFELSDLMIHLPLRRGLSKYYEGKSQSFTSLASVENIEDLAKKMSPYVMKKKMKTCKSYLNVQKSDIRKKSQRGSFLSNSFRISSRPNSVPLHKINF